MTAAADRSRSPSGRHAVRGALRRPLGAWLLALVCAGCAAPPAVHFHSLVLPMHPAPKEGLAPVGRGPAIVLDPIRIPVAIDQPQWLLRLPDDTLTLLEQERWASPLRDEFRQALMEILRHRYGAVDVRTIGSGATAWRLHVTITRFELQPGEAWLESVWSLGRRDADTPALRCRSSFRESSAGGMPALGQAQRRAVEKLGDAIGEQLLAVNGGQAGRCPT